MDQVEIFLIFSERIEKAGIDYMATGSVGSMMYGVPRFTHDLDLVIDLAPSQVNDVVSAFPLEEFYCPPVDVIQIESRRPLRGHFNIIHHKTGFKADMYVHRADTLQQWGLSRRKRIEIADSRGIWVAPPEYIIVRKLEYYREGQSEKHLQDIAGMLEVSGDIIDRTIVEQWVEKLNLTAPWAEVRR